MRLLKKTTMILMGAVVLLAAGLSAGCSGGPGTPPEY